MYEPLKMFTYIGLTVFGAGVLLALRFIYAYFTEPWLGPQRYTQSLIAMAVLMILGFQVLVIGLLADVISGNRKLIEDVLYRVRSLELRDSDTEDQARRLTHAARKTGGSAR
jgi:hypothetical protein